LLGAVEVPCAGVYGVATVVLTVGHVLTVTDRGDGHTFGSAVVFVNLIHDKAGQNCFGLYAPKFYASFKFHSVVWAVSLSDNGVCLCYHIAVALAVAMLLASVV